jgi:YHS domain-containing protein
MDYTTPRTVPCPMCQMPVDTQNCQYTAQRDGRTYFFCADGCRQAFLAQDCCAKKPKGWWGRYLDRLGRVNDQSFGAAGPKCH